MSRAGVVRGSSGNRALLRQVADLFGHLIDLRGLVEAHQPASSVAASVPGQSMVARIGFSATTSRESRQGRKAAAAAAMSGAGARAGAGYLPRKTGSVFCAPVGSNS
jgi:hypothetical protein